LTDQLEGRNSWHIIWTNASSTLQKLLWHSKPICTGMLDFNRSKKQDCGEKGLMEKMISQEFEKAC